jgi:uncharacterized small protein (DUF1192 family)
MLCDPSGAWVAYEEYARLQALTAEMDKTINASQAECRRLKAELDSLMTNPTSRLLRAERDEVTRLKAEVERLERAGDLMLKYACVNVTYPCYATMAKDWNAAKEGKQS